MSRTFIIVLVITGLASCGALCAASFKAQGRSPRLGFVLGAALGPLGLFITIAMYVVGRSSYPENTGTFASPHIERLKRYEAPEGTGTFAPQSRKTGGKK